MSVLQFPLSCTGSRQKVAESHPRIRSFTPVPAECPQANALWGVPGKHALMERLGVLGSLAPDAPLSFVLVKVNGLQAVNHRSDARAGEELLHQVAARLRELTRGTDMMGRLSGSTFGVVLQGTGATAAAAVAARLSHHLNQVAAGASPAEILVSAATGRGVNAEVLPAAAMESLQECC